MGEEAVGSAGGAIVVSPWNRLPLSAPMAECDFCFTFRQV